MSACCACWAPYPMLLRPAARPSRSMIPGLQRVSFRCIAIVRFARCRLIGRFWFACATPLLSIPEAHSAQSNARSRHSARAFRNPRGQSCWPTSGRGPSKRSKSRSRPLPPRLPPRQAAPRAFRSARSQDWPAATRRLPEPPNSIRVSYSFHPYIHSYRQSCTKFQRFSIGVY